MASGSTIVDAVNDCINAFDDHPKLVALALENPLLFESKDLNNENILMKACAEKKTKLVDTLLHSKYFSKKLLTDKNSSGHNALMISCMVNDSECIDLIMNSQFFDPSILKETDVNGKDSLMLACGSGSNATMKLVNSDKFDKSVTNNKSKYKKNALVYAIRSKQFDEKTFSEFIKIFNNQAIKNVDAADRTPIIYASFYRPEYVKFFLMIDSNHEQRITKFCSKKNKHIDKLKSFFVDANNTGFSYLHILAIFHPHILTDIIKLVDKHNLFICDNIGRKFYEYLPNKYKRYLNDIDNSLKLIIINSIPNCDICFENEVDRSLPCGHVLCAKCLNVLPSKNCHICRFQFVDYNVRKLFLS